MSLLSLIFLALPWRPAGGPGPGGMGEGGRPNSVSRLITKNPLLVISASVGQRLLQPGDLVRVLRLLLIGGLDVLQLDRDAGDLAGELERRLVGFRDGRSLVGADIGALVGRIE